MTLADRGAWLGAVRWLRRRILEPRAHQLTAEVVRLTRRLDDLALIFGEHPTMRAEQAAQHSFPSPAVSVILPTWNRAAFVGDAIRSVQAQSFADWELLVLDDGSTDDTASVMAGFAVDQRIRFEALPHAGQCVARNHGQAVARGAIIAYIDSDNLWYPGFLAAVVALLHARPDIDCTYGAMVSDIHQPRLVFEPFDRNLLLKGNFIDTSTFAHRRSLTERYGGFDSKASPVEDWDLVLRYTEHAPAFALPVPAVRYRSVDDQRVSDTQTKDQPIRHVQSRWRK